MPPATTAPAPGNSSTCAAAAPAERCCTRVLANATATLRLKLRAASRLASVAVWREPAGGPPLFATPAQAASAGGADISIGDGAGTLSGCMIGPQLTWTDSTAPAALLAPGAGYAGRAVICGPGTSGSLVRVAFPSLSAGLVAGGSGPPPTVAVRICTVPLAAGAPVAAQDAVLWLQDGAA